MNWTIEIKPDRKWYDIDFKGIWRYRSLLYMYVRRDMVVQYKQTVLGPLWYILQPICTTIMYMFVFGGLAGISTDGVPQPLFYMAGIMLWNYFAAVFSSSSTLFVANAYIFGKVYFPRMIVPISAAISAFAKFIVQFGIFALIYVYFLFAGANISVNADLLILPVIIIDIALFGIASGLIITSITAKYHDLNQVVTFGIQLYMYATPIIYPLSAAPEKYKHIIMLNPLSSLIEATRYSLMGCGAMPWEGLVYSTASILLLTAGAVVIFSKTERTFMDTI